MYEGFSFLWKLAQNLKQETIGAIVEILAQFWLRCRILILAGLTAVAWLACAIFVASTTHGAIGQEPHADRESSEKVNLGPFARRLNDFHRKLRESLNERRKELAEHRGKFVPAVYRLVVAVAAVFSVGAIPVSIDQVAARTKDVAASLQSHLELDTTFNRFDSKQFHVYVRELTADRPGAKKEEWETLRSEIDRKLTQAAQAATVGSGLNERVTVNEKDIYLARQDLHLVQQDFQLVQQDFHLVRKEFAEFRAGVLGIVSASKVPPTPRACAGPDGPIATIGFKTGEARVIEELAAPIAGRVQPNESELKRLDGFVERRSSTNWLLIEGQASRKGEAPYNADLSAHRAERVRDRIAARYPDSQRARQMKSVILLPLGETLAEGDDRNEDRVVKVWDCGEVPPWTCVCGSLVLRLAAR